MKILWRESPQRVRDIRSALAEEGRSVAHTSVITTLNVMFDKGLLRREKDANAFLFAPAVKQEDVSNKLLGDVVGRVFDGSARQVMLSLLDCADVDRDELKELRRLINQRIRNTRDD